MNPVANFREAELGDATRLLSTFRHIPQEQRIARLKADAAIDTFQQGDGTAEAVEE